MKKVCISANTSWYLYNFRATTISFLQSQGFEVFALAPEDNYTNKLNQMGCRVVTIDMDAGGRNFFNDYKSIRSVDKIFKKERPDIILNFTPKCNIYNALVAKKQGIPFVNNISGVGGQLLSNSPTSLVLHFLYKLTQKHAAHVFFQNEDDMELFVERGYTTYDQISRIMGSGVDLERFYYREKSLSRPFKFILVARMLKEKGVFEYVNVAKILKSKFGGDIEFQLLGFLGVNNPSAISEVQMTSWTKAGDITYLGISDAVEDIISKADCVVLPSYYGEGVPKSLIEAAALGTPIITTTHAGCRDVVDEGINGFLCAPQSTESLMNACEKMYLLNEEDRLAMGLASHKKAVDEFSDQINIALYYEQIMSVFQVENA